LFDQTLSKRELANTISIFSCVIVGTHGFEVVRFGGKYSVFYRHYDSYPEGLGSEIVAKIPTDPQSYAGKVSLTLFETG
jgi:hypothetical protein